LGGGGGGGLPPPPPGGGPSCVVASPTTQHHPRGALPPRGPPPIAVPDKLEDGDIPEYFLCPITGCIMRQPAMTPEGVTYDYDAIAEWLSAKQTDPSTNLPLTSDQLCPNRTLRSMIEDFIAKGPEFLFAK